MPRRAPIVIAFVLLGAIASACGSFLGLSSDDDEEASTNEAGSSSSGSSGASSADGGSLEGGGHVDADPDGPHGCVILGGKCGASDQCCPSDKADNVVHRCGDDSHCLRCLNVGSTGCRFNLNMNCCPGTTCAVGNAGGLDAAPSQFRCCIEEGEACTSSADCCVGTCNKLKCAESI